MMRDQIESALLAANGSRAGASVPAQPRAVREQMIERGLMTKDGNLTALGAVTRSSVSMLREDEAFG
jgi:hypothetical protein